MNSLFRNFKILSGIALIIIRFILPLAMRVLIILAFIAFFSFLYIYGEAKHTMKFGLSLLTIAVFPFRFPFLMYPTDVALSIVSGLIVYGGTAFALFWKKSPFVGIGQYMFLLPFSDLVFSIRYLWHMFRGIKGNFDQFLRFTQRYFRIAPIIGVPLFHLTPEVRAITLEIDQTVASRMQKINQYFRNLFSGKKFVPYVEKVRSDGNQTVYECYRPDGFSIFDPKEEKDSNPFLHFLGYEPNKFSVSADNGGKLRITVEDISKPLTILPFSEILPQIKCSEYVFGMDIDRKELVRMKLVAGANSMIVLVGLPGTGKTSLLSSLFLSMFETNGSSYQYVLTSTKPDLAFTRGLEGVLRYADDSKGIIEATNLLLSIIEARKKLFTEKGARNIAEYNEIPGVQKLPIIFSFNDELSDSMKAIEAEFGKPTMESFQRAITQLSIKARAYGIVQIVAIQSALVSLFGQSGSEFKNSFSPIAFCLRTLPAENSVFGDTKSGAYRLPVGQAVWFDQTIGDYRRIQVPLVSKMDIDSFLMRNTSKIAKITPKTEEAYIAFAKEKGSLSFQDAETYNITDRRYRALCIELQESGAVKKLPNNTLVFESKMQSEKELQKMPSSE